MSHHLPCSAYPFAPSDPLSILLHPGPGPRKVNFMNDIKVLPCCLTSSWFCSIEDTAEETEQREGCEIKIFTFLFPLTSRLHGFSLAVQSTEWVGVTWPSSCHPLRIQGSGTTQMLRLWLLLLMWVTNCPLSLIQDDCILCQHPWNYNRIICQLVNWVKSQTNHSSWDTGVLHYFLLLYFLFCLNLFTSW